MVKYKGRPIGYPGYGVAHLDYISSFKELFGIIDDPEATQEQVKAAKEEISLAMDDFS